MYTLLGAVGPGWYMEGMAELLGTHRWQEGQLQLRVIPDHRQEVPMWGRIKLVRDAYRDGKENWEEMVPHTQQACQAVIDLPRP